MQVPHDERAQFACTGWRPRFVDYFFVAFTQSSTFGPTDAPLLARWAKILSMIQIFDLTQHRDSSYLARGRSSLNKN